MFESISICEDWEVVNAVEYKKLCIFIAMAAAAEAPKDFYSGPPTPEST
jgi:hypothetical protein